MCTVPVGGGGENCDAESSCYSATVLFVLDASSWSNGYSLPMLTWWRVSLNTLAYAKRSIDCNEAY